MLIKTLLCSVVFLLIAAQGYAKTNSIKLVLPEVDGWAHVTEKSFAPEALNRIAKGKLRSKMSLNYRPFKRALLDFKNGKFDCFVGGDEKTMLDFASVETISSEMIRNTSLRIYTLKNNPKLTTFEQMKKKRIIYVRGLDLNSLQKEFKSLDIESVTGVKQAVKMMKSKRVDAFLHWFPSTDEIMTDFHNTDKKIYYTIKEKVNCHINEESKKFISQLNNKILKFKKSGGLKKLHFDFYGDIH